MTQRPTIFAYVEQSRGVRDILHGFTSGPLDVVQVDRNGVTLQGHQCGVFVNITTHVCQPPAAVWDRLHAYGFIIWSIDDSHARNRMAGLLK